MRTALKIIAFVAFLAALSESDTVTWYNLVSIIICTAIVVYLQLTSKNK